GGARAPAAMSFELTSEERAAADALMKERWMVPKPSERASPWKTIIIWVVLICFFIAFYQVFRGHPDPEAAPLPPELPSHPMGVLEVSAVVLLVASLLAFVV